MESFKLVFKYLKKYAVSYAFMLFIVIIVSATALINPYIMSVIVRDVLEGGQTQLLFQNLGLMIIVLAVRIVLRYGYQMYFEFASQNVMYGIMIDLYKHLQNMDSEFYSKNRVGDLMTRMSGDMDMIRHYVAFVIYVFCEQLFTFIAAIVMMMFIRIELTLILIFIFPAVLILSMKFFKQVRPAFMEIRKMYARLNTVVQENISGNRIIKAFAKEDYETEKFNLENDGYKDANIKLNRISVKYMPLLMNLGAILTALIITIGGIFAAKGYFDVSTLVLMNGMLWMLVLPLSMMGNLINDVQRFNTSAERVRNVLETMTKIDSQKGPKIKHCIEGKVEFRDVSFTYENVEALKNISFIAEKGKTIGILGPTGSGKSTLTSMISRFYDPDDGIVLIDDINIKNYDIRALRDTIAIADQDIFLFSDTIEGNIAYGAPGSSMSNVYQVAKGAGAHGFILNLPEGYDTIVGERGVGLSGGQKQRIALARALLKNPAILILDDTTSSVDAETESFIFKSLERKYDCTTFIIAHRISSIMKADLILVLEDGRIAERGTHEELLANKAYYYSVFESQCGDFSEGGV